MKTNSKKEEAKDLVKSNQVTGNIGMYYVCYILSGMGWNVMSTARNAKGIDVVIYNHDASKTKTMQVKALTKQPAVPLGKNLDNLIGDYFIICTNVRSISISCYILKTSEVRKLAKYNTNSQGEKSYWLQPKSYCEEKFNNWNRMGKP